MLQLKLLQRIFTPFPTHSPSGVSVACGLFNVSLTTLVLIHASPSFLLLAGWDKLMGPPAQNSVLGIYLHGSLSLFVILNCHLCHTNLHGRVCFLNTLYVVLHSASFSFTAL